MDKKKPKNQKSTVELVYPIYLDTPMMTAFLASLEGGLVEQADIEDRTSNLDEKSRSFKAGINISGLLTGLIGAGTDAELARKISEGLESHYKSTVRFPSATLFIRLRKLLFDNSIIRVINSKEDISSVSIGDLVEVQGLAQPNPAPQLRKIIVQMMPILEEYQRVAVNQLEQTAQLLKSSKPGSSIKIGEENIMIHDANHVNQIRKVVERQKQELKVQSETFKMYKTVLDGMIPEGQAKLIPLKCHEYSAVCRVYPSFVRDEDIEGLYDGNWKCIGKVANITPEGETFDLLKDLPIGYFAKDQVKNMFNINAENIKFDTTDPQIQGPVIELATLAIFL
jgi:hypothetical protein